MLNLNRLLMLLSAFSFVLLMSSLLLIRLWWFYPHEQAQYIQQQQFDLDSINATLELISSELLSGANELTHSPKLLQAAYSTQQTLQVVEKDTWQLASLAIIAPNHRLRFSPTQRAIWKQDDAIESHFSAWFQALKNKESLLTEQAISDIIRLENYAYYLVVSPIHNTENNLIGWLVFLRQLDSELKNYFEYITNFKITKLDLSDPQAALIKNLKLPIENPETRHQRCLYDRENQPVLCYELTWELDNKPIFLNINSILVYSIGIFIPISLFSLFVFFISKPIRLATQVLNSSNASLSIQPLKGKTLVKLQEIEEFRLAYNRLAATVNAQRSELEKRSNTDKLTQIPNRNAFDESLKNTWQTLCRRPLSAALVLIDIDYFKPFNDHYGHLAGDKALYQVAQAITGCARRSNEIAARFGGEEFVLVVYIEDEEKMRSFIRHLQQLITELRIPHAHSPVGETLSISAGISWIQNSGSWLTQYSSEDWLAQADKLLYEAKDQGRKRCVMAPFSPQQ